MKSEGHPVIH